MNSFCAAVDIGGTKITVGIVSTDCKVLISHKFPTPVIKGGGYEAVENIYILIKKQCEELKISLESLDGIGIVCTGPVDVIGGYVDNPYTLPGWGRFAIVKELKIRTKLKVMLENDANGALLGEIAYNKIDINTRVLMLTFGTGIGTAFWDGEQLHRCEDGTHAEMGHILISTEGKECYCGNIGCFESLCSGSALNRRSQELGFSDFDELYFSAQKQDEKAIKELNNIKTEIKNGIWSLCTVFHPDIVSIGGGLATKYFDMINEFVTPSLKENKDFVGNPKLMMWNSEHSSALVGALMVLKKENENE